VTRRYKRGRSSGPYAVTARLVDSPPGTDKRRQRWCGTCSKRFFAYVEIRSASQRFDRREKVIRLCHQCAEAVARALDGIDGRGGRGI
jgi:hypothetical protein